jgi:hypothetical protein
MLAMAERPDDPVADLQAERSDHRDEQGVERNHLAVFDIVADLPAEGAAGDEYPCSLGEDHGLPGHVVLERCAALVGLADVVRRAGQEQPGGS